MTTIAYDGQVLATDSLLTGNGLVFSRSTVKALRLDDGSILACAGDAATLYMLADWVAGIGDHDEKLRSGGFTAIMVTEDGALEIDCNLCPFPVTAPWACGSGEAIAMTAMHIGKSAVEAVYVASELDTCTGGAVVEYKL